MDSCTSGSQGNQSLDHNDYIGRGESSAKVDRSIELAWVGAGAAFDESGHSEVWEIQEGVGVP